MKQSIVFATLFFLSQNINSQPNSKNDTTVIIKTDNYSNFKAPAQADIYYRTIDMDSSFFEVQGKQGKVKTISFEYDEMTRNADHLFRKKDFLMASELYILAFKKNNNLGQVTHRYNTACCFAITKKYDSAFQQLYRIAERGGYYDYFEVQDEKYLTSLHADKRWEPLILLIKANAKKLEEEANSKLQENN
jgi:hypothetical protein